MEEGRRGFMDDNPVIDLALWLWQKDVCTGKEGSWKEKTLQATGGRIFMKEKQKKKNLLQKIKYLIELKT